MLDKVELKGMIKTRALTLIDEKRVVYTPSTVEKNTDGTDTIVVNGKSFRKLREGDDGMNDLIDSVAQAVAEKVIEHLMARMEIRGSSKIFEVDSTGGNVQ
jgi:hypothetical protein